MQANEQGSKIAVFRSLQLYGLPFLGTLLLIYWIAGGFPPPAWSLSLQLLLHLNLLQAEYGSLAFGYLTLSLAQSLLLAVAWLLPLWALLLTVRDLVRGRPVPHVATQSEEPQAPEQPVTLVTKHAQQQRRPSQRGRGATQFDLLLHDPETPDNPFEGEEHDPIVSHPTTRRSPTRQTEPTPELTEDEHTSSSTEEENPFKYGNPFEGPLPEVFTYDLELQRSMQEIAQEVRQKEYGHPRRDAKGG